MKLKGTIRRFFAGCMICLILCIAIAGDCLGIHKVQAAAAGAGALAGILESVVMSLGFSYATTADLYTAANGMNYAINNIPSTANDAEKAMWSGGIDLQAALANVGSNAEIHLTESMKTFVTNYVENSLFKRASYTYLPSTVTNVVYQDISNIPSFMSKYNFLYTDWSTGSPVYAKSQFDSTYDNRSFMLSSISKYGEIEFYISPENAELIFDSVSKTCRLISGSWDYFSFKSLADGNLLTVGSGNATMKGLTQSKILTNSNIACVYVMPGRRVYSSRVEYDFYRYIDSAYQLTHPLYGSTSAAKDLPYDDAKGGYAVPTVPTRTQQVENIVTSNPDATDEDIDTAVTGVLTDGVTDEDGSGGGSAVSGAIMSMLTNILTVAKSNALKLEGLTDGSSALDITGITDAFEVIEGGGGGPSGDEEPHIWAPASVPVPKFLKSLLEYFTEPMSQVTKFLKKITDSIDGIPVTIADNINEIPVLGSINKAVTSIPDTLTNLPKAIADALPKIEFPSLEDIKAAIEVIPITIRELPKAIADALPKIEFPSLEDIVNGIKNLPQAIADSLGFELPDFLTPLQNIVKFCNEIFLIDSAAINVATGRLTGIWDAKFPIINKLGNLFNAFSFSDTYAYPVFKLTTPDILKAFYPHEDIVLLDFSDYKTQVVWCRNILRGMIWFAFAYYLFKHFDVSFHVG